LCPTSIAWRVRREMSYNNFFWKQAFISSLPLHKSPFITVQDGRDSICRLATPFWRPCVHRMQLGAPQTKIGRPKTSIQKSVGNVTATPEKEPEAGKGSAKARPKRKTQADEIPMYKVILLSDDEYEEGHVVTQLQKICQLSKNEASRVFIEAQSTGSSVVCVVPEEHAEFYAQQLKRADIYVTIEKDE
jgi:ATP-dependent Clp protease adaptor protein ClpS